MIELIRATDKDRTLLWNVLQKYLHELAGYYGDEMDGEGNYPYRWFGAYFTDPERTALLIRAESRLVGFALLNPYSCLGQSPDHSMAEFTVFPAYRGRGLARAAAERIISEYPGCWEIKYCEKNAAAKALWASVAAPYDPRTYPAGDGEAALVFTAR